MKTFYTTILAVIWALSASAQQQSTLVFEDFHRTPFYVTLGGNQWELSNSSITFDANSTTELPSSAVDKNHVKTKTGSASIITYKLFKPGFVDVQLTWLQRGTGGSYLFEYSVDGVNFSAFNASQMSYSYNGWSKFTYTMPVAVNTEDNVTIRWTYTPKNASAGNEYRFDELYISGINTQSTLPVELVTFQGQTLASATKLVWATATEVNNEKFVVERSQDGVNFSQIGEVRGFGNSSTKRNYNFTDNTPVGGVNYYRLRQVDLDGTESFSSVVALEAAAAASGLQATVYPTAASQSVTISLQNASGNTAISVVDITGRTVATFTNVADHEIELPVHSFRNGVYFVKVIDGQNQQVQRFIKQ